MNIQTAPQSLRPAKVKPAIVDVDIHPKSQIEDLKPHMSNHWWDYLQTYGNRSRHGVAKGFPYPKGQPLASRRDSWPPDGGLPASNLEFMQAQHLDHYGITHGVMNPLSPSGQGDQNAEFSAAMCYATNEVQLEKWHGADQRLKCSVVVPYEDGPLAAKEVRRRAGDKRFAHVLLMSRTSELLGKRRYWPIYEAAAEAGLPIGIHVFGYSGWAMTNTGWPSFYIEEMTEHSTSCQALVASMIVEGVFEHFPKLKVVMIESGFAWMPALGWRLDNAWKKLKSEVPHLKRTPSEYLREHFWVSTQPMEEPDDPQHVIDVMNWIGMDHILFASDYPHWDFDDPFMAMPPSLTKEQRQMIFSGNAQAMYGFA